MLRKVDMSPFQGFLSLAIWLVGALPRPEVCDPVRVGCAHSTKWKRITAEGNALGQENQESILP